jgi:hypothetical protein
MHQSSPHGNLKKVEKNVSFENSDQNIIKKERELKMRLSIKQFELMRKNSQKIPRRQQQEFQRISSSRSRIDQDESRITLSTNSTSHHPEMAAELKKIIPTQLTQQKNFFGKDWGNFLQNVRLFYKVDARAQ